MHNWALRVPLKLLREILPNTPDRIQRKASAMGGNVHVPESTSMHVDSPPIAQAFMYHQKTPIHAARKALTSSGGSFSCIYSPPKKALRGKREGNNDSINYIYGLLVLSLQSGLARRMIPHLDIRYVDSADHFKLACTSTSPNTHLDTCSFPRHPLSASKASIFERSYTTSWLSHSNQRNLCYSTYINTRTYELVP